MNIITIKDLTYGYEDCPVFENFSINFEQGKIYCIVGENGAGKTTLLKCISSLVNDSKCILYNGKPLESNKDLLQNISYVMSEDTLYPFMTVRENIKFYSALFNKTPNFQKRVTEILSKINCTSYNDTLVKNLSQGTRNKIYLAIMLMLNPLVLYLSYKILKGFVLAFKSVKNTFYEKMKKKTMIKKLDDTNKSTYCIDNNIKWNLGESGYWLELEKIIKNTNRQTR